MKSLSRRLFTRSTTVSGLACSLIPGRVIGANNRVNVGVMGCGWKGGQHIKSFREIPDVAVLAVSDADTRRMDMPGRDGKEPLPAGIAKVQDFRKILDMKEIDALVIAAPNHWHCPAAIMACQAGKHAYVEKPVSHSIWEGRKMVEAARKYNRIVQGGTQRRSSPAVKECAVDIRSGKYGKVLWAHVLRLNARDPIGKVAAPVPVPDCIDYNLWAGPAPMTPVRRKQFHYDWHWQWNWGDGETANNGVHFVDVLRDFLGWDDVPSNVISAGNRWWDDDGQTPNMHLSLMEHEGVNVVVDIRNMRDFARGDKNGAIYRQARTATFVMCENGYVNFGRGGGKAYDQNGKMLKQYKGNNGRGHDVNFISAIRAGSNAVLNCEIEVGHYSTVMCHLANISYRAGTAATVEQVRENLKSHGDAIDTLESILTQLDGRIDFRKQPFILGPKLNYDNTKERFIGKHAREANQFLNVPYREPFGIPDRV